MYLDYTEYKNMGGTLDETTFTRYELESASIIDFRTFNRLEGETEIHYKVKMLDFKLIELLQKKADALTLGKGNSGEGAYIKKQSNDGVATEYSGIDSSELYKSVDDEIAESLTIYLTGVKNSKGKLLSYRGVYPDE